MKEREAFVVVDLGFGDAGKGTVTDALVRNRRAHIVVRFNGSAQAGHNVVTADGRHHTFSQVGSGTFVPGVRTHLARQMVVHPTALLVEARHLADKGVSDTLDRLTISESALVITPFHQAANRLRELSRARQGGRHGSCGVGLGETMADALTLGDDALRARDLADSQMLRRRLLRAQRRKRAELGKELVVLDDEPQAASERRVLEDPDVIGAWLEAIEPLLERRLVVPDDHLGRILKEPGAVVFEGAQGVLLDEWRGFHPYTTWSTCTFDNALELLREHGYQDPVSRIGVLRVYAVRHGPGPFPTAVQELAAALSEPHNPPGPWQGAFRAGWPDLMLLRYALSVCSGADGLAVTHLDILDRIRSWRVCQRYHVRGGAKDGLFEPSGHHGEVVTSIREGQPEDLKHQSALTEALMRAEPVYTSLELDDNRVAGFPEWLSEELGLPVWITSTGPTADDKEIAWSTLGL